MIVLCPRIGHYDSRPGFEIVLCHPQARPTRHNIDIPVGSMITSTYLQFDLRFYHWFLSPIISSILSSILSLYFGYNVIIYLIFNSLQVVFKSAVLSNPAVSILGGPAEMLRTTLVGTIVLYFSCRVSVSIEQSTVCHLHSIVACDWECWFCPSQESSLLVELYRVSVLGRPAYVLVHQSTGPLPMDWGLHEGICWWEHQKLKDIPLPWADGSISWTTQAEQSISQNTAPGERLFPSPTGSYRHDWHMLG